MAKNKKEIKKEVTEAITKQPIEKVKKEVIKEIEEVVKEEVKTSHSTKREISYSKREYRKSDEYVRRISGKISILKYFQFIDISPYPIINMHILSKLYPYQEEILNVFEKERSK